MENEQKINLLKKCIKANDPKEWNEWCASILKKKKEYIKSKEWKDKQSSWEQSAQLELRDYLIFSDIISGFYFPGELLFNPAIIVDSNILFNKCIFHGNINYTRQEFGRELEFTDCKFKGKVIFCKSVFNKNVNFARSIFYNLADFGETVFKNDADFGSVEFRNNFYCNVSRFEHHGDFSNVKFEKNAEFYAINVKGGFDFVGASFKYVPDFVQAHFLEAPRLDMTSITETAPKEQLGYFNAKQVTIPDNEKKYQPPTHIHARYLALKRLAIQAHDHKREQNFFAAELKALRGDEHKIFGKNWGWYWAGIIYEGLSDFARSPLRIIFWMVLLFALFMQIYLYISTLSNKYNCEQENPLIIAGGISISNTLMPIGVSNNKTDDYMACLYGIKRQFQNVNARIVPDIPSSVAALFMVQRIFAILLIFLLILSVRAHFRVK